MTRKNLKVDEIVHEELIIQKRRDESFNDVLKRVLGIRPTTIEELVSYFPDSLSLAAENAVECLRDEDRFNEYVTDRDENYAFVFDSKESDRTIMELRPVQDDPSYLAIRYRNEKGQMTEALRIAYINKHDMNIAQGSYNHPKTGELIEFNDALEIAIADIEDELKVLRDTAYDRWG